VSEAPSSFALRFISGKYQGGEFPLPDDKEVVIGRGGELDIVLVEDMVSRKHAKITTAEGKIVIQDLGSTNGTFVNGEKIKRARLKEGDRVLIGTSILKLINAADTQLSHDDGLNPQELAQLLENERKAGKQNSATTMSGSLSDMPLSDLLQMMSSMRKSGTLAVTNGEDSGRIYLREGQVYYAILGDNDELGPEKALFRMLGWAAGEFRLGPPSQDEFMLELEEKTDSLLLEGARQQDELRRLGDDIPEPEDMLSLAKPMQASLAELDREQLEILQLVHNLGFFQSVLDNSHFTDLKTSEITKVLVDKGYVQV
jgi:pSer/pThr/pTyr-binding forkhead associated (FHA) protein